MDIPEETPEKTDEDKVWAERRASAWKRRIELDDKRMDIEADEILKAPVRMAAIDAERASTTAWNLLSTENQKSGLAQSAEHNRRLCAFFEAQNALLERIVAVLEKK